MTIAEIRANLIQRKESFSPFIRLLFSRSNGRKGRKGRGNTLILIYSVFWGESPRTNVKNDTVRKLDPHETQIKPHIYRPLKESANHALFMARLSDALSASKKRSLEVAKKSKVNCPTWLCYEVAIFVIPKVRMIIKWGIRQWGQNQTTYIVPFVWVVQVRESNGLYLQ